MKVVGTALGPQARRLARGAARGRTARNIAIVGIKERIIQDNK